MKKAISLVLALVLLALPCLAEADDTLSRILEANSGDALRSAHESRLIHSVNKDESDTISYTDEYYIIQESPDFYEGIRVRTSEYDYVALKEGGYRRYITLQMESDPWEFYPEGFGETEVVSTEETDGSLIITMKPLENYATDYYPDAVETKEIHVFDADSLELQSYQNLAVLPDGSEEAFYEVTVEYDVERIHPEVVEALEKHLYEEEWETRTTTFIFDEDRPLKRTYTYETPVGDGCLAYGLVERGIQYEFDMERSTPSNDALDNDAVYYMVRAED